MQVDPAPATDAAFTPSTFPATLPTSLPTSQPTSQPTTQATTQPATRPIDFDTAQGDVIHQVKQAIEHVGLTQTVSQTPLTGWLLFAISVFLGLALGRLVGLVLTRAGVRAASKVRLVRAVIFNSFNGPITLLLFMCGAGFGLTFLELSVPLQHFLIALFQLLNLIWIGWLLYNLVDLVTIVLGRWSRGRQGNLSIMLVPLARKTLRCVLVVVLVLFAVENIFGQDVKTLLAGVGIAGLAVSLAAQDTLRNFFGSIMIFADQPFAIGDRVKILDFDGKVEDIGFRSTRVRTIDGYVATIPNGNIAAASVLNYSRRRNIRRTVDVTLTGDVTQEQLVQSKKILNQVLAEPTIAAGLDPMRPPTVTIEDAGARKLEVVYWFKSNDFGPYTDHAERFNLELVERFREAGIAWK